LNGISHGIIGMINESSSHSETRGICTSIRSLLRGISAII
jgi:hypothetical protein